MTSVPPSASTTFSPPPSRFAEWTGNGELSSSRHHLKVPTRQQITPTSTDGASSSRHVKRTHRETTASPPPSPRRQAKRVREATPLGESNDHSYSATEGESSYTTTIGTVTIEQNASGPASMCPTTVAGPSSYIQDGETCQIIETSEGGEGEDSVLFSEQTGIGRTDMANPEEEYYEDGTGFDDETIMIDGAELSNRMGGENFLDDMVDIQEANDDDGTNGVLSDREDVQNVYGLSNGEEAEDVRLPEQHPTTIDLRKVMPPPADTTSHKSMRLTSSRHSNSAGATNDQMTQVIEKSGPNAAAFQGHSFVNLNEESYSDGEDQSSPSSYHSGDTDFYDMDHRPVLERTAIKRDIRTFTEGVTLLREGFDGYIPYTVIDRLGEGTFSSVYLALDNINHACANEYWTGKPDDDYQETPHGEVRVALKKILATSSPARIENELHILETLRGCRNVSQLITAFREEDQVIIVLPYHRSDDFRHFYRLMDPPHIQSYLRSLFRALKDIHLRGIVHRDVKPANFLYDYEVGEGVLVDFGLAERYFPPRRPTCQHAPATLSSLQGSKTKTNETPVVEQAVYDARKRAKQGEGRVGFPHEDKRPTIKTNRAGTRGFRAPEVLLKCPDQTVAIDIWSAGVMLLSILTHKFPIFNSSDDIEALMEIAAIFGRAAMERCALLHNRTIISNVPTVDTNPPTLADLVLKLNPHIYTPHMAHPTPEDAQDHIEAIDMAINLCQRLLRLDATKRLTADQALRHPFLAPAEGEDEDEEPKVEIFKPTEGKCGDLHQLEDGKHRAYFHPDMQDLPFGQGIPASRNSLCPEHEHFQQRFQVNPLSTRRWVYQAAEDADEEAEDQGDEDDGEGEGEGDFVIERQPGIGAVNGKRYATVVPLKQRDVNAPSHTAIQNGRAEGKRIIALSDRREVGM